jgi:hypothetical protein
VFVRSYCRGDGGDPLRGCVRGVSGISLADAHPRSCSDSGSPDGDDSPLCVSLSPLCVSLSLASISCRRAWRASSSAVCVETLFFLRSMSSDLTVTRIDLRCHTSAPPLVEGDPGRIGCRAQLRSFAPSYCCDRLFSEAFDPFLWGAPTTEACPSKPTLGHFQP